MGNLQKQTLSSLYSPTANHKSMSILFAIAFANNLWLSGYDVHGAFCKPSLPEDKDIYVRVPKTVLGGEEKFWKLKKTLYGLRESSKAFYDHVSTLLISKGYCRTMNDPCMFFKRVGEDYILMVIHVDDFACATNNVDMMNQLETDLETEYVIEKTKSLENYLGIHIRYNDDGTTTLCQPKALNTLFTNFNFKFIKLL